MAKHRTHDKLDFAPILMQKGVLQRFYQAPRQAWGLILKGHEGSHQARELTFQNLAQWTSQGALYMR
jgi:hypothetical protein